MNNETTNRITENTAALQFKVVGRSPNNLPNDNSEDNFQYIHNNGFLNLNGVPLDGTSYLRQFGFDNPVVYDGYFKRVVTGKQIISKAHRKNIYSWQPSGSAEDSIYIFASSFVDPSEGTTACELFYVLFSLEIVL